jgi:hypothetical protein
MTPQVFPSLHKRNQNYNTTSLKQKSLPHFN